MSDWRAGRPGEIGVAWIDGGIALECICGVDWPGMPLLGAPINGKKSWDQLHTEDEVTCPNCSREFRARIVLETRP